MLVLNPAHVLCIVVAVANPNLAMHLAESFTCFQSLGQSYNHIRKPFEGWGWGEATVAVEIKIGLNLIVINTISLKQLCGKIRVLASH